MMRTKAPSPARKLVSSLISLALAALCVGLYSGLARSENIRIEMDRSQLLPLDKSVAEVIVGNPSIADVHVQSSKMLVVTGKSSGVTNLILLDNTGRPFYEAALTVTNSRNHLVTLNRGRVRESYGCEPACGPALIPGDESEYYEALSKALRSKLGMSQGAAEGTNAQQ